ncbi:MAG: amidase, partial [Hydrogenophaga sp.]|nr:amidase [Hydrogenophaga sp.]
MNDLLHRPLRELATRLVRRELTAEALVRACIERIAEVDASIEAWTALDTDRALRLARSRHQPAMDAACVGQLRTAGAYVLGKTVTTEFATMVPGKTRNPHSPPGTAHTPGGSSSGSAAAVAARMVPLALGTQTAASVVRPAAYCGVVGFKPTFGLLPVTGVKLQAPSLDTVGVFTRAVDDAAFAVGAMARLDLSPRRPATLRAALCRTPWWDEADADARRALAEAGDRLKAHGVQVIDVDRPPHWAALTDA